MFLISIQLAGYKRRLVEWKLYRYRATFAHHTAAISSDVGRPGIEKTHSAQELTCPLGQG